MKTLLILRHAKSSWGNPDLPDHDRPLNDRGKRDAPRIGQLIRDQKIVPQLILSSTAKRAHKTAEKVAEMSGFSGDVVQVGDLYLATPETYIEVLNTFGGDFDPIMVVGHNPGIESLLTMLTGADEAVPTAALAHVSVDIENWAELARTTSGTLVNFWRPRDLD